MVPLLIFLAFVFILFEEESYLEIGRYLQGLSVIKSSVTTTEVSECDENSEFDH